MAKKKPANADATQERSAEDVREEMAELMLSFDNNGIAIDESQWSKFTSDQMNVSNRWRLDRIAGNIRPVPPCLLEFCTEALQKELSEYQAEQAEKRKTLMHCVFGKPSLAPKREDGTRNITINIKVPVNDLSDSTAAYCTHKKRVRIEFSLRGINEWKQQDLPGVSARPIYTSETEIHGNTWKNHKWLISFIVTNDDISEMQADELWSRGDGTCRIEVLGDIAGESDEDEEVEQPNMADKPKSTANAPDKRQIGMPFEKELQEGDKPKLDDSGDFAEYDEYPLEFKTEGCRGVIRVAIWQGRCYSESVVQYKNIIDDQTINEVFGMGHPSPGERNFSSVQNALSGALGSVIDEVQKSSLATTTLIDDLRANLKAIESGTIPHPTSVTTG